MWDMTESALMKAVDYSPKLRIEVTAFGGPGTRKTTTLYKIRKLLEADGFITRINEEAIPGMASRLEALREQSIKAFPGNKENG